jgi:hypothetical protein
MIEWQEDISVYRQTTEAQAKIITCAIAGWQAEKRLLRERNA